METLKKSIPGSALRVFMLIFMLSGITILSSCTTTVRTPRHHRNKVVIVERQTLIGGNHHDNGLHLGQRKHRK